MDRSCCGCGLDMPKPIEGVIFSHPCRAWPVKLEILCMSVRARCGPPELQRASRRWVVTMRLLSERKNGHQKARSRRSWRRKISKRAPATKFTISEPSGGLAGRLWSRCRSDRCELQRPRLKAQSHVAQLGLIRPNARLFLVKISTIPRNHQHLSPRARVARVFTRAILFHSWTAAQRV